MYRKQLARENFTSRDTSPPSPPPSAPTYTHARHTLLGPCLFACGPEWDGVHCCSCHDGVIHMLSMPACTAPREVGWQESSPSWHCIERTMQGAPRVCHQGTCTYFSPPPFCAKLGIPLHGQDSCSVIIQQLTTVCWWSHSQAINDELLPEVSPRLT